MRETIASPKNEFVLNITTGETPCFIEAMELINKCNGFLSLSFLIDLLNE